MKRGMVLLSIGLVLSSGCGTRDHALDPAQLSARDLLGIAPEVAASWDEDQRAAVRLVLEEALTEALEDGVRPVGKRAVPLGIAATEVDRVLASIAALDHDRAARGAPCLPIVRIAVRDRSVEAAAFAAPNLDEPVEVAADPSAMRLVGWERGGRGGWADLPDRAPGWLAALARAAGFSGNSGTLEIMPAPREPFAAAFLADSDTLLVNPVLLAALEPRGDGDAPLFERVALAVPAPGPAARDPLDREVAGDPPREARPEEDPSAGIKAGNPYSFYGSVNECAASQRLRCEACLDGSGDCDPQSLDEPDGSAECQQLAGDNGRGYYLFCINMALAINTVSQCVTDGDTDGSCLYDPNAAGLLSGLDSNLAYLNNPTCTPILDNCLSSLYGPPDQDYPDWSGPGPDAGPGPPPPPPRDVVSCAGSDQFNCDFSPDLDINCGGCQGGCSGCETEGCGTCSGCSSDGCNADCGSCSGGTCSGGSCGGEGGSCGGEGGSCGGEGGSCGGGGGGSCGNSGGGSSCGSSSGGGGSSCTVTRPTRPGGPWAGLFMMAWAILPLPVLGAWRRREKRRRKTDPGGRRQGARKATPEDDRGGER